MILECNNCGSTEDTDHHCWVNNVAWNVSVTEQGYLYAEMDDHEENREVARKLPPEDIERMSVDVFQKKAFDCRGCGEEECVVRKTVWSGSS